MKYAEVIDCKSLGIRADPTITEYADDVVEVVKAGTVLIADDSKVIFSWDDKAFFSVETPSGKKGYANVNCLKLGKGVKT